MDREKLAALASDSDGIFNASQILDVDENIYFRAVQGLSLSRLDRADIDSAWAFFEKTQDEDYLQDIDRLASRINDSVMLQNNSDFTDNFMLVVAEGQITTQQVEDLYTLWGNLNGYQANVVMEKFATDPDFNADRLTELYSREEDLFNDYENSAFWEWFRETFYGDN